jgi:hypothetical protein
MDWHQSINRNVNNYPLTTAPTLGSTDNTLRTYPGFGGITQQENTTNGNYNGFQTGVRIQNRWGLSGEVDYTWSHEIDITSADITGPATPGGSEGAVSNPWNLRYDKGSGGFDRRQILSANYVYHLPIFNKSQGFTHAVLGGWTLAGTFVDQTGEPVNLLWNGSDTIGLGGGYSNRPNVVGKLNYPKTVAHWFDPTAFGAPTPGFNLGFGNSRKDTVVGPGRVNFTTSVYKDFAITERAKFELRVESFNTFNHTQWKNIDNNFSGSDTAGDIQNTWDPRVLQFGGTFSF